MRRAAAAIAAVALVAAVAAWTPWAPNLPPIVFVARAPLPAGTATDDYGSAGAAAGPHVPGLGPRDRTRAAGGRLLLRHAGGRIVPLVPDGTFFDVSDPDVSWDGTRVVFAATPAPDEPWRLWTVGVDGRGLAPLTFDDRETDLAAIETDPTRPARYDDLDPRWLPDGRVVFASTRFPQVAHQGGGEVTNLFTVTPGSRVLGRVTTEREGAEEPSVDPVTGRIVYARWWFSPFMPSDVRAGNVTTREAEALDAERVDVWQVLSAMPDGSGARMAGGNPRVRAETMAYQPIVLDDGTLVGVRAAHPSLVPSGGALSLVAYPGGFAAPVTIAGGGPDAACAPAALPDGRILFSYDPLGRGDFGLWVARPDGRDRARAFDLPGTLELDAVPAVARRLPPVLPSVNPPALRATPKTERGELPGVETFRFDCLNVFTNAGVDVPIPDAPPLQRDLRIRFYAVLARPGHASGDSLVLVRESPVDGTGGVHEDDVPADTPMFEQLVDAHGRVVQAVSGPAHVPGFNAARMGVGTQCVGCHVGHSAIAVPTTYTDGRRFNASPSARIEVSSVAEGTKGASAIADRRAAGPPDEVAWVAAGRDREWIRLCWDTFVEVDTLVIYPIQRNPSQGTDLRLTSADILMLRDGAVVGRRSVRGAVSPAGTRVACGGTRVDAIEVRPRAYGQVGRRPVVAIGEIETLANIAVD